MITLSIYCPVGLPQILLNITCKLPLFIIMLILTPYILVSSLVPSCKLFLIQTWVLVFALSDIGRAFPFYASHLCSYGSTLGDIFWAMVRALSIFITVMFLPVSCLNPSSTTINSENFAHLPMTTW